MIEWFRTNKSLRRENKHLQKDVDDLEVAYLRIVGKSAPEVIVSQIMRRGIAWFDYTKMEQNDWRLYYNDAQAALKNKTLQNEIKHFVADIVEHIARRSKSFKEIENLRMHISAYELLKERLEGIENPDKEISKKNLHSAI